MGILRRIKRALTAASPPMIGPGAGLGPLSMETAHNEWQHEATRLYNIVPELRYGIYWIASSASRSSLIAARRSSKAGNRPDALDPDHPAAMPLTELAPTAPEQSLLIYRCVTLMKLLGQWRLVGFDAQNESGEIHRQWLVVSPYDYRESSSGVWIHDPETDQQHQLSADEVWSIPMRFSHPIRSSEADSPVRALIPTLHELIDLSGHVQTAARSRLAGAGLLLMPNSLRTVSPGQSRGVNPPDGDPTMRALTRTAQASIRNPHDVSRHLPVIVQGNQEALNAVRHMTLSTEFDARVDDLRLSAVRRLAIGLDLPAEILSGMGDLNHWTAWQVESSGQRVNIEPTLSFLCRELTLKFYRPALRRLRDQEGLDIGDPDDYMVWYDDSAVANQPNSAETALAAYDMGLISDDAARTTLGYSPSDKATQEDIDRLQQIRAPLRLSNGTTNGDAPRNGNGPAAMRDTQVTLNSLGADATGDVGGWEAALDIAARRALRRSGQYLLGSGGRAQRGRYRDVPLDEIHTKITPVDDETVNSALRDAYAEIDEVAPHMVPTVDEYVRHRLLTGQPHNMSVLRRYIRESTNSERKVS